MVAVLSGRDTLGHLSKTLRTARSELERLERDLQAASSAVADNRRRQAGALKRLAGVRLDAIRQGDVARRLDAADHEVEAILSRRRQAVTDLEERVAESSARLDALEERRDVVHEEVEEAANRLAEREARVQDELAADQAFQTQLERTRETDAIAVGAAEKAEIAAEDRQLKGEPYESDELFMYLWRRGYGTVEYRANRLARLLDAWVARLCRYADARPNYWMLLEIPRRLQDHAERLRDDAELELAELQRLEEAAAREGGVHEAQAALAGIEQRQDDIDEQIAATEADIREHQAERSRYAAGEDEYIAKCLDVLTDAMEHRDIHSLTQLARATMTAEDDAIVDELKEFRGQDVELQDQLRSNRELYREHLRRLQELEQVRQQFKRHRYDDLRSGFENGDLLIRMMGEVLGGAIRGNALWDVLRRYQRYRDVAGAWPDFGSGGIARTGRRPPARRPTWHWPGRTGPGRRGGFNLPRPPKAPKRGRGGFRTGGGF